MIQPVSCDSTPVFCLSLHELRCEEFISVPASARRDCKNPEGRTFSGLSTVSGTWKGLVLCVELMNKCTFSSQGKEGICLFMSFVNRERCLVSIFSSYPNFPPLWIPDKFKSYFLFPNLTSTYGHDLLSCFIFDKLNHFL